MKSFIRNPFKFFLSLLGYEIKPPSPILRYMLDVTHSSWLDSIRNNGTIKNYEYNLYS